MWMADRSVDQVDNDNNNDNNNQPMGGMEESSRGKLYLWRNVGEETSRDGRLIGRKKKKKALIYATLL